MAVFEYLRAQHKHVVPLYELDKARKLGGQNDTPPSDEAKAFFEARFIEGGQMLGAIWLTAYRAATPDTYLRAALIKRQTGAVTK